MQCAPLGVGGSSETVIYARCPCPPSLRGMNENLDDAMGFSRVKLTLALAVSCFLYCCDASDSNQTATTTTIVSISIQGYGYASAAAVYTISRAGAVGDYKRINLASCGIVLGRRWQRRRSGAERCGRTDRIHARRRSGGIRLRDDGHVVTLSDLMILLFDRHFLFVYNLICLSYFSPRRDEEAD